MKTIASDFLFHLGTNICMCGQLHAIFYFGFLFLACHCSYAQLQVIFVSDFWRVIIHTYKWLQVICYLVLVFLPCHHWHIQTIASHIFIFISGVQFFVCVNNCKSSHILFLGVSQFACVNNHLLKGLRAWIDGRGLMHHTKPLVMFHISFLY